MLNIEKILDYHHSLDSELFSDTNMGSFNPSCLNLSFAFEDIDEDSIPEIDKIKRSQAMYHELYHLYQSLAIPTVVQLSALRRYEVGIMTYIFRLFINENRQIDSVHYTSLLDILKPMGDSLAQPIKQIFEIWEGDYCNFMSIYQDNSQPIFVHQLVETSAYLFQNIMVPGYLYQFNYDSFYTELHQKFTETLSDVFTEEELLKYHLLVINLSLSVPIESVEKIYLKLCDSFLALVNQSVDFMSVLYDFDLVPLFHYRDNEFIEEYYKLNDKKLQLRFNKFCFNLFGSTLYRNASCPTELGNDVRVEDIKKLLLGDFDVYDDNRQYVNFIVSAEKMIKNECQLARHDYYEFIFNRQCLTAFSHLKLLVNKYPDFLHPFFMVKMFDDPEAVNVIMKTYLELWEQLRNKTNSLTNINGTVSGDAMYEIDFIPQMEMIFQVNELLKGHRVRCCQLHGRKYLGQLASCNEKDGLKKKLEKYYSKPFNKIFTGV